MATDRAPAAPRRDVPAWLAVLALPVREPLEVAAASADKPLGQMTMTELLAWAAVAAYGFALGTLAARIAANLASVALRGRG